VLSLVRYFFVENKVATVKALAGIVGAVGAMAVGELSLSTQLVATAFTAGYTADSMFNSE